MEGSHPPGEAVRTPQNQSSAVNYGQKIAYMNPAQRRHFVAMTGEFVGTTLFLWFAFSGAQVINTIVPAANPSEAVQALQVMFLALTFGFSLMVNVWVFYRISGGLFNPAVTLALVISGALPWARGACLFVPQMLGGMVAAALVSAMFPGPMSVATTLSHDTSVTQGLFIEMFLTALLTLTILMLAVEKSKTTFMAPVGIGLALFVAHLSGVYFTGASLNPTRSFGPHVATRSFPGHHWIYWLGPVLGACIASGFYRFIKFLLYEEANPNQDAAHKSEAEWMLQRTATNLTDNSMKV
ncbi:hypothetical protein GJ744_006492 [Endocarpon pusillum]|uniref:Aquaporin-1 n=1 Tax=Endocarpon pusillum TaxID=364733 RepID=A0A8H7AR68_9EURO|nr:hypothetical protein GJ744_006492 [Endocarpon pusillum]